MKLPAGHVPGVGVHKATAYGGLGEKLLKGWGWEKGQGVGKNKQGISEAIEVVKKDDNAGIGGNNSYKWEEKWWEAAFNANAQSIKERVGSDSDSDSDSHSDSDDDTQLTTCQAGLLRNRDGTVASSSAAELAIAASVAKDARGWAGRFGGREGKMGRIRRQEAEAEEKARIALGLPSTSGSACEPPKDEAKPRKTKKSKTEPEKATSSKSCKKRKDSGDTAADSRSARAKKSREQSPSASRGGSAFDFAAAACTAHAAKTTPAAQKKNWWGSSYFVSAGYMGGMEEIEEEHKRQTFSENDQENLYNKTQDRKVAKGTRLGLGVRGSEVKIAGGKFQGTKVKFDEDVADDEASPSATDAALMGVKWKKIITKTLLGAPKGSMRVKKLQKAVAAAVLAKLEATVCVKYLEGVVMQKLTSSSKFVVDGKTARCC